VAIPKEKFMFKLYARPGAGSAAVEALLALTGAKHEVINATRLPDGSPPPLLLAVNPRGEVPALQLPDDSVMTESAAMMIYLADLFPDAGLAPPVTAPQRPHYLRALLYLATTAYMSDLRMYYPARYSGTPSHAPAIKEQAIADLDHDFDLFADLMGKGPFVLGAAMSAADLYAAMLLSWSPDVPGLFARQAKLKRLYDAVAANPQVRKVWDQNKMP